MRRSRVAIVQAGQAQFGHCIHGGDLRRDIVHLRRLVLQHGQFKDQAHAFALFFAAEGDRPLPWLAGERVEELLLVKFDAFHQVARKFGAPIRAGVFLVERVEVNRQGRVPDRDLHIGQRRISQAARRAVAQADVA